MNYYLTLDQLEEITKRKRIMGVVKNFLKELLSFTFFVLVTFIFGFIFLNFNLFADLFFSQESTKMSITSNAQLNMGGFKSFAKTSTGDNKENMKDTSSKKDVSSDNFENLKRKQYKKAVNKKIEKLGKSEDEKEIYKKSMKKKMKGKIKDYDFDFNLLPPDNRLMISKIGVEAPIVNIDYISRDKMEKAEFDGELKKGVVKYPFTDNPGEEGNALIFGHTSTYWWKDNPYGKVFSSLPQLRNGDEIKVVWNGKMHKYEVFKKLIRRPSQVSKTYKYYKEKGKVLTLMGCYPIGTDAKRILVLAKAKNGKDKITFNR